MNFEPRNLMITGGAGFIGTNFVRHWLGAQGRGQGHRLRCADLRRQYRESRRAGRRSALFRSCAATSATKRRFARCWTGQQIDTLVHFAAESHVDRSILGPDDFIRTNVVGTHALLKAAKAAWIDGKTAPAHRFHHVSTDEVYGSLGPADAPFHEATPYAPNSPYSASKAGSDHLVRAYHETYGLHTTITNCSNNYGPYHFPEKLIPLIIINILTGKPLPVYGDGLQVRDWLHVADHCVAIELALTRGAAGEVYNIGGNSETTNIDIVRRLCALADEYFAADAGLRRTFAQSPAARGEPASGLISHVRDRPGHDRRYAIDYRKAQRELGYQPGRGLGSGLRSTFEWYLRNTAWWQALLGRDYKAWMDKNYRR